VKIHPASFPKTQPPSPTFPIEVGYQQELKEAEKEGRKAEQYKELEDEYLCLIDPARTANAFLIKHIIDPKDARSIFCAGGGDIRQRHGRVTGELSGVKDRSPKHIEQRLLSEAFF
jgi:hypothetical protein